MTGGFTEPGLTSWREDATFTVFAAALCWIMCRAGFRIGIVARASCLSVTDRSGQRYDGE